MEMVLLAVRSQNHILFLLLLILASDNRFLYDSSNGFVISRTEQTVGTV